MIIHLAFSDDDCGDGSMPLLVSAVDEYTIDNWGRIPDWHRDAMAAYKSVREATIHVADSQVDALFAVPAIASSALRPVTESERIP